MSYETAPNQLVTGGDFANEYYKLLTAPDAPLAQRTAATETEPYARLSELFAPHLTRLEAANQQPQSASTDQADSEARIAEYSRLLAGGAPRQETLSERLVRERQAAKYATPTEAQKKDAYGRLQEAMRDPQIKNILDSYGPGSDNLNPESMVDAIRTDAKMRYELGSYFLRDKLPRLKQEYPHSVPERLWDNSGKTPNHKGYYDLGKMSSPEYAAVLALSMLDGTFERVGRAGDPIQRHENGNVQLGQHRAAAAALLAADPYNPRIIEETLSH